jgi:KDO2-lipid IV(A) lauroyltransferase
VCQNISRSFPAKSEQEIKRIAKKFYQHFCDLIIESLKLFSISKKELETRMKYKNLELFDRFKEEGKDIIAVGGHYNNWEMIAVGVNLAIPHTAVGIYMPLSNPFFEKKLFESRSRYGMKLIPKKEVKPFFSNLGHELSVIIFGADQSPSSASQAYWTNFLNQETAVAFGTEKYAKEYGLPVIFCSIKKQKRGYYESTFELITDRPRETKYGEITEAHTRLNEKQIRENPEFYLWTHRRWKKKRPAKSTTTN